MKKADSKPPTMEDVALRAGVSRATVSTVLSRAAGGVSGGNTRVSAATREKIFQVVADLHYRPNLAARSLREQRTNQIGFYNEGGWMDLRVPFFAQIVTGIYEGCYTTGKSLLLHTPPQNAMPQAQFADVVSGTIDGLIVKTLPSDPLVPLLAGSHLGVVAVVDALPGIPSVVSDDEAGGRAIAEHLASRGHRQVFFQQSDHPHTSVARRLAALQNDHPWQLTVEVGTVPNGDPGGMCAELEAALRRPVKDRPTAVVCWNDRNAASVLRACRERGLSVPRDVAIVGYDDGTNAVAEVAGGCRITSVRAEWGAVAREAVYCLAALLGGGQVPNETVLPSRLIAGDTT